MSIQVINPSGNERVFAKLEDAVPAGNRASRQAWFVLGKDLKAEANRAILAKNKTGRVYIIRSAGGRRRHRASAPGQSHANLTGELRRSLSWRVFGHDSMDFGYGARGGAPRYAKFVELGTTRMDPRPTLQNALDASARNAELAFVTNLFREFDK